ncbi:F-box protein At2g26160-like [Prunus dulcis]|uniref:F-box protein At2g26160-like n=1 Tax=Prunus dulcis TaxID=3755 RepID=UPI00148355F8|nr:F-box protein At2g26160-like [Prunus dulcis]
MGDGGANVRDIILSGCGSDFDPEWASLPLLVVFLVLDKLMELIDHVRFAAVCKEWSCLAKDYNRSTQRWSPMLMIPTQLAKSIQTLVYSDCEGKIYKNIQDCCYHYNGGRYRYHQVIITLSNPFSSSKAVPPSHISLPPLESEEILFALSSGREVETRAKVMLSADPALNPDSYAVIAFFPGDYHIFYTGARFTEEGRSIWRNHRNASFQFYDAIFYKGLVYAADHLRGLIHSFDLNLKEDGSSSSSSRGEYITTHFMVFKVPPFNDEECESYEIGEYVELESLGDEALFVGDNYSLSVLASKFRGCQPNCIYFTDDSINFRQNAYIACDMGIFNLRG